MARKTRRLTPRKVAQALKRRQAVALRVLGCSFSKIAGELEYSGPAAAFNAVDKELRDSRQEGVEHLRDIEHKRYEAIIHSLFPSLLGGGSNPVVLDAIKTYISLSARMAKLLGLDVAVAPTGGGDGAKAEASVTVLQIGTSGPLRQLKDLSDQELMALVAQEDGQVIEGEAKVLPEGKEPQSD